MPLPGHDPYPGERCLGRTAGARAPEPAVDAIRAALTLPWSSGPVEGEINKPKLVKRSMYGHAGLDHLRARVTVN